MSSTGKFCNEGMMVTSMGTVEAIKDERFDDKRSQDDCKSFRNSNERRMMKKRSNELMMEKVVNLGCLGPNTVRF